MYTGNKEKARKAAKAVKKSQWKKALKPRYSVVFHRPKTLKRTRNPKVPRVRYDLCNQYQWMNFYRCCICSMLVWSLFLFWAGFNWLIDCLLDSTGIERWCHFRHPCIHEDKNNNTYYLMQCTKVAKNGCLCYYQVPIDNWICHEEDWRPQHSCIHRRHSC